MRTAGAVYRKLKEVKHAHLIVLYKKYLRRSPENCKFNYKYTFIGGDGKEHEIRLCLLHQKNTEKLENGIYPNLIDVCEQPLHCHKCNGFVPFYTKEGIKEIFEKLLEDNKIKTKKYPDICALEWVLERPVSGIWQTTWIQNVYFSIKRFMLKRIL